MTSKAISASEQPRTDVHDRRDSDDEDDLDHDEDLPSRYATTSAHTKPKKSIRTTTAKDDSDSEFEFDL